MTINRVSNFALLNGTLADVTDVQKQLATLQEQISSGLKSKNYQGLGGQVEQYAQLDAKIRAAGNYISNNDVSVARLQTADSALQQMVDIVDDMEDLMIQARGATGDTTGLRQQMRSFLETLTSQLNVTFGGKYIFSGTNTSEAPVPDAFAQPVTKGVPDDGYYAGSSDDVTYSVDEQLSYGFPVRADDTAFQQIFAAAMEALNAFGTNNADADLEHAISLIQEGQKGLATARGNVNNTIVNINSTNERLSAMQLYWKGLNESVVNTDLVAASTQVASYEAILQATFSVYARLSQLRLSDYLR